jgi:hypothetical protein
MDVNVVEHRKTHIILGLERECRTVNLLVMIERWLVVSHRRLGPNVPPLSVNTTKENEIQYQQQE